MQNYKTNHTSDKVAFISITGKPQAKQRPRYGRGGVIYTPQSTLFYENKIKKLYKESCRNIYFEENTPVTVTITAFYGIPKNASKADKEKMLLGLDVPCKTPDLDNIAKIICDGLNGLAYADDKQIGSLIVTKRYATNPKVEVEVQELKLNAN